MLTCAIAAGLLFISNGADERQIAFSSVQKMEIHSTRSVKYLRFYDYDRWDAFKIPDEWNGLTADGVINACLQKAEG